MTVYKDSEVFESSFRSPMPTCSAPDSSDFEEDNDTLIWANIAGEMRLYSFDGVKVQYQTMTLSGKVDA